MIIFADTSALGSVYLDDELDSPWIREVLFDRDDEFVVSALADVEVGQHDGPCPARRTHRP